MTQGSVPEPSSLKYQSLQIAQFSKEKKKKKLNSQVTKSEVTANPNALK